MLLIDWTQANIFMALMVFALIGVAVVMLYVAFWQRRDPK